MTLFDQPDYVFAPNERPLVRGSPHTPWHPLGRRVGYAVMGILVGSIGSLGNALVTTNVGNIAGNLGLYVSEANLMTALYYAMYAGANLVLIKARAQFGIPLVVRTLLLAYLCAALLALLLRGFATEIILRAASGM